MLISPLLLAALVPQDLTVSLTPRSGPATVVHQGAEYVLRVTNEAGRQIQSIVEVWVSPEISFRGVPGSLRLSKQQAVEFGCTVHVEADRPAGPAEVRVILRDPGGERLAHIKVPLRIAVGRDFLRHSFENRQRGDAPDGLAFLRLTGEGSHALFESADSYFQSKRFRYLTCWLRNRGRDGALTLSLAERQVEVPLPPTRSWKRIVVDLQKELGDASRVSAIAVDGDLDLDEFAVVRSPEPTMGDRMRSLTLRHHHDLTAKEIAALGKELAEIKGDSLSAQELVDYELLRHDLEWQRIASTLPRKQAGRPAGKERFEAMLRHRHHLEHDCESLRRLGREQVRRHQEMLDELAGKVATGKGWRQVAEALKRKHPTAAELPGFARKAMQEAMDFTIAQCLVTVPHAARHARIQVVTKGPLSRTYPFGGYGGFRPSGNGFTGTYFVSPPAEWMNEQEAADRLRGNHCAKTRVVALHEVVPGHHLQGVVHRLRPLSQFRRRFYSTVFGEGWALYCEETMHRHGFFDLETRFAQLQMRLWRAARVVVDVGLHTGELTMPQAERLLVEEVGLDPVNAKAEVLRYIDNPTRPMSYLVGFLMIDELEAAERSRLGDRFDGRVFRDRLLAFGAVPLPAVLKGFRR